jgi:Rieske Fe-S protein
MADTKDDRIPTTRRTVLAGVGAVGVVGSLAACGSASSSDAGAPTSGGAGSMPGAAASGASGGGLANTGDIPVGSGKIFEAVVVTQPTAGNFKAFSTTCTHQGCQVSSVGGGVIKCPCHGSEFSISDGSVKSGPARAPLAAKTVTVKNGEITVS